MELFYRKIGKKTVPCIRLHTIEEENAYWRQCCYMVINCTRFVLDKLEQLPEFQVRWENYHKPKHL